MLLKRVDSFGELNHFPVRPEEDRELNCLQLAWKAIKEFFYQLFCSLCCCLRPGGSNLEQYSIIFDEEIQESNDLYLPLEKFKEHIEIVEEKLDLSNFQHQLDKIKLPANEYDHKKFAINIPQTLINIATTAINQHGFKAIDQILKACLHKMDVLNKSLSSQIDQNTFMLAFQDLLEFNKIYEQFVKLAGKDCLSKEDCETINHCAEQLFQPHNKFYAPYPNLVEDFKQVVLTLSHKPLARGLKEQNFEVFSAKFSLSNLTVNALQNYKEELVKQLDEDIQKFMLSVNSKNAPNRLQAEQLIDYYSQELKKIQNRLEEIWQKCSNQSFPIKKLDVEEEKKQIGPMIRAWQRMLKVAVSPTEEKVSLLNEIKKFLHLQNDSIWNRFPQIQLQLIEIYNGWHNDFFSNKTFFLDDQQDQKETSQIKQLTSQIGQALGCKEEEFIDDSFHMEMDESNDTLLSQEYGQLFYEKIGQRVANTYLSYGAAMAAQFLYGQFKTIEEKGEIFQECLKHVNLNNSEIQEIDLELNKILTEENY